MIVEKERERERQSARGQERAGKVIVHRKLVLAGRLLIIAAYLILPFHCEFIRLRPGRDQKTTSNLGLLSSGAYLLPSPCLFSLSHSTRSLSLSLALFDAFVLEPDLINEHNRNGNNFPAVSSTACRG